MFRDFTFAIRVLRQNPIFAISAIASLALGIGANTAVFSLVNTLIFRPLPVVHAEQLVRIGSVVKNGTIFSLPGPVLDDLRKDRLLHGVCGFTSGDSPVEMGDRSGVVVTLSLTGDCYQTLGVRPALGRLLTPADDLFNAPKVAVLGYEFWKSRFGGNPAVLGRTIKISGVAFQIIGVTEPRFQGLLWGYPASVSAPISQRTGVSAQDPSGHFYWAETLARLRAGVTAETLKAQLRTKWQRVLDASLPPGFKGENRAEIISMPPTVTSGTTGIDYYFREHFETALLALLAISVLVLLVACVNVANLMFARGLQREREIGIRLALGAGRVRVLKQLLLESGLLLLVALGFAFALAIAGAKLLAGFFMGSWGRTDVLFAVDLDWRVLLFTALVALLAVLVFAILPAWRTSDVDPAVSLKAASRSVTGSRAGVRKLLLVGQVAMTLVILVGADVFAESIQYLRNNALSFGGDSVVDAQLMPIPNTGPARKADGYFKTLVNDIGSLPQVRKVSLSSFAPLVSSPFREDVRPLDHPDRSVRIPAEFVTDSFIDIMHMPLLAGRDFRRTETAATQRIGILSQFAADRLFPDGHAIGRHIQFGSEPETRDVEVVGVVADRALEDPHMRAKGFLLLNIWQLQRMADWGNLQVTFSGSATAMESALRREIEHAGHQQIFLMSTLSQLRERSLLQDRLLVTIGKVYVVLVLLLAAVGLSGLLLFFVGSREKEMAIRMALGAELQEMQALVVREAVLLIGAGALIGTPLAYIAVRSFSSLVYGVAPTLISPVLLAFAILSAVAVLSVLAPMRRAGAISPNDVLRNE